MHLFEAKHLHLELRLQAIPHEIVVVDDGSTDRTWKLLQKLRERLPELLLLNEPLRRKQRGISSE